MSFYQPSEALFVKKLNSIKDDVEKNDKVVLLRFLNTREQELLQYVMGSKLFVSFSSFSEEDEYRRAFIASFAMDVDFKIVLAKLNYNKRYLIPNHRMILGAVMSYGLTRDSVGDIYITEDNDIYIAFTKEIYQYIKKEFKTLSHQSVELEEVSHIDGMIKHNYLIKTDFIASLRLDIVVASMYNLSRKESQEIVSEGRVKVNQKPIDNLSHQVRENDVISIKGLGKMKVLKVGGLSKRDRLYVKLGKYM